MAYVLIMLNQPTFTPLRENLGQQVYQHLRDKIYRMEIAPGTRLGVSEIAEQLGVSRSPVRDALMMLVNEGVVELNSTGGYRVIQLNRSYIEDAFVVRRALELAAMQLAMTRADRKRIEALRAKWLTFEQPPDTLLEDELQADRDLHKTIAEMSGNRLLIDALERITSITWLISRFSYNNVEKPHYGQMTAQEHVQLLDAMLAGDLVSAVAALDTHLNNAFARSLERLDTPQ
jgi:GntR family transcriptional regulator, rspAB operon transcriptional repressor